MSIYYNLQKTCALLPIALILVLVGNHFLWGQAPNTWTQKSSLSRIISSTDATPTARYGAVGFSIGNKGYVGTGRDADGNLADFWEYDPANDTWTQKADFGGSERVNAVGFSVGNKGYVGTGYDGSSYLKDFWEYDPANNIWTQKADCGGSERGRAVGFSIDTKGYVGTGYNGSSYLKDFWEYNPTGDTWVQKTDFAGGIRAYAAGFSIDTKGYVGTGYNGSSYLKDFWEYNPTGDTWVQKTDFAGGVRSNVVGFSISNKGYVGIGYNNGNYLADFWEYAPTGDTWTKKADFGGSERAYAVGFSIGNKGYVGTGYTTNFYKDFWEYDPTNSTWTKKADFDRNGRSDAVGFSIGDKGYVGTGTDRNGNYLKDFWEYDPNSDTWTQKADFGGSERTYAVGFSIGNKGYVGTGSGVSTYKDFWEYDPVNNTWTKKADLGGAARIRAVGFSIGNKGYLGTGHDGSYLKDFWEYDPITDKWTQKTDFAGAFRSGAVGFPIGSKGYMGTGLNSGGYFSDFWEYDPAGDTWASKANFAGTARSGAVGFSIGSKGYIGPGFYKGTLKDFWEYDPTTNVWTKKADFAGETRASAVGFSIGSLGYMGMGTSGSELNSKRDFWQYTPSCTDPTANITYTGTPFCNTLTTGAVTLTGTNAYTGGTFSSTAGLSINSTTGEINPSASTAGTYLVTYIIAAAGGCAQVQATASVTITPLPTANITYAGTPFCKTLTTGTVTLTGTNAYTGGSYSSTAGLSINPTTGEINPSTSTSGNYNVTYTIAAAGGCAQVQTAASVTITALPTANITYSGTPFCKTLTTGAVTLTGTNTYTEGTFSSTAGLSINATTGEINPSTSTAGTYSVTYTIAAAGGCAAVTATASVTITPLPTANISYAATPFCKTLSSGTVTLTGTNNYTGGSYSSTTGLSINSTTGEINPNASTAGTYLITYTIAAAGGCAQVQATATVTITPLPTANISYAGSPFCSTLTTGPVTLMGTNAYTGGSYSSTPGLSINSTTGEINPSTSTAGTYLVTYTIAAAGGCTSIQATATVAVTPLPTANISYASIPFCKTLSSGTVTLTGTNAYTGGSYSSTAGLSINPTTGEINPNAGTAGTYSVTYTIAAAGGCAAVTATASLTIHPLPIATISGTTTVCQNAPSPSMTFTGSNGMAPYTFIYKVNGGGNQTITTTTGNSLSLPQATANAGVFTYTLVSVSDAHCSQTQSGSASITVNGKPSVTLTTLGQTLNEGNNPTLCDTDANPTNGLTFHVMTACISGPIQWRTQVGLGAWSAWSSTAPTTQPSDNTAYKYQAACDANCPSTFSGIITLTINYRAFTPQNVSMTADGTTVAAGESKTLCDAPGNAIYFNVTCAAGELVLYSVDGANYSTSVPFQIVDNNFHNYRVRCRKADNTPSCVETESVAMSLKITTSGHAPTVSIAPLNGCGTPASFSGTSSCGVQTTIWYNAATDQTLPSLPNTTPTATTSYYVRCQNEAGCLSEKSNTVTFTIIPVNNPPVITASADMVCAGTQVTISANCPSGSTAFWNTGVNTNSFQVAFNNVTTQTYWAKCVSSNGCQSPESVHKSVFWKAFELTFINVGQSQSASKPANDRNLWVSQFIMADGGPILEQSTQANPTLFYTERPNKGAPCYWTIQVETCHLSTDGSVTYDLLAAPEVGVPQSFNTHENNAPYLMYANREGWTELYAQNHPAYGFYQDNGSSGNTYDTGLPKGLYKLGIRYWDQKGQGSIYPSTRQPAGNVLAYQEYWFRIQSQSGIGAGASRIGSESIEGGFAQVSPNPVSQTLRLKISEAKGRKVSTSLMDASGRTLLQRSFTAETDQHQEEFEVSHLANGMYFLHVKAENKQTTLKVIKVQ